jgi:endonuclease/exonuclease/phosphatase (EEP) superfamily protein YafD
MLRWLDRVLLLLTALLVAAHLLPLGSKFWWVVELTSHFRVQYLLATLVLLLPLALRRRYRACATLVAAAAVSVAAVVPYLPLAPSTALTGAPLKIMSVNISFGRFSPQRLREIIRVENPDVFIAQELTPYADGELAALDEQFPYRFKLPADGAYGIGLWSRLELQDVRPLALARLPAIQARVRSAGGTFTVLGVHLSAPTSPRRAQSRGVELRELAARSIAIDGPLLIAGDFNISPYSPYFTDFLKTSGLRDARQGRTLSGSWPTTLPVAGIPIDHVIVNEGFAILDHRRLPNFGSDHYGIVAELALRSDTAAPESP